MKKVKNYPVKKMTPEEIREWEKRFDEFEKELGWGKWKVLKKR